VSIQPQIYNRIEGNNHLTNKKALFYNMTTYYKSINQDEFLAFPVTYHVKGVHNDNDFLEFKEYFEKINCEIRDMSKKLNIERRLRLEQKRKEYLRKKNVATTDSEEEYYESDDEFDEQEE
jgi:hypothetical protein